MNLTSIFRTTFGRVAFALAHTLPGRHLISFVMVNMSFVLPVEKLRQTPLLLAFYHPKPAYPVHILILPRRAIGGLLELGTDDADFLLELFATVKSLVVELGLEAQGYRLIANGGPYQDLPLLHFHLISGDPLTYISDIAN